MKRPSHLGVVRRKEGLSERAFGRESLLKIIIIINRLARCASSVSTADS
jgi:hypothetical protein